MQSCLARPNGSRLTRRRKGGQRPRLLLMQDDFLHYQVTLARSLDVCRWWTPAQQLPGQATFDDRKTVWAQLNGDSTTVVAGAQGWMDYLMNTRGLQPAPAAGQDAPELSPAIVRTMRDTFRLLDTGRQALATLDAP